MNKVITKTEKHPKKRGYAIGKLQKFLKEANLTKRFRENCREQRPEDRGHKCLEASIAWIDTEEGLQFWKQVNQDFNRYLDTGKVLNIYED
ncbi:MAG: hypothetical protein GQ570_08490 [Helicobacteraceae bacterium]|nr:hypothetical protein [Helicobacteraceae bacterium]